jgi:gamma-glutamylcyclotransferase (GGCT)/AIG2-like uncharacterized protein YtfP
MSTHLFTYGSLVVPAVMETVTGRSFRHAVAQLRGFERFMLKGRIYPGVLEARGRMTSGRVYFDLDEDAISRLDYFEADEYDRRKVEVELDDKTIAPASVYAIPDRLESLMSDVEWDEAKFVAHELDGFLEQTRNSMLGYVAAT